MSKRNERFIQLGMVARMRSGGVTPATKSVSALGAVALAAVLFAPVAEAQHPVPNKAPPVTAKAPAQLTGPAADKAVPAALERQILGGVFEQELEEEFGRPTIMALRQVYAQRLFKPVWTKEGADSLYDVFGDHFSFGIAVDDMTLSEIREYVTARQNPKPEVRAASDIALTIAYLRLANAISGGLKDEGEAVSASKIRPARSKLTTSILTAGEGNADEALSSLEPDHPQYEKLKKSLLEYRKIKATGGWHAIRSGKLIRPGDEDARVPNIRKRLAREGYDVSTTVDVDSRSDVYDETVADAVRRFQKRHGLKEDGVVGPNTLTALNESVESKINRIADNIHRWRHQGDLGPRYIRANIPSFRAEGWNRGKREISMKTIVGRPSRQTPVFSDRIEYVVTNPKWYVPVSIARRDKLPKLRKDPGYAERGNYVVIDRATKRRVNAYEIDWTDPQSARKYQFVQQPGEQNALGRLKILFPNQYSVYLHGTPSRHLFDEAKRTFSSGCIRLEDPVAMAKWLSQFDPELDRALIEEAVDAKEREWMPLDNEIPVHVTYHTVTVEEDGKTYFWRDVYNKDDGIQSAAKFAPLYSRVAGKLPDPSTSVR